MSFNDTVEAIVCQDLVVPYRPSWTPVFGENPYRILFLQQVYYKWVVNGYKAFHAFLTPSPSSRYYTAGQSWTELLGCTKAKINTAKYGTGIQPGISTKVTKELAEEMGFKTKKEAIKFLLNSEELEHLILTSTDSDGRTWHFLNTKLFVKCLEQANAEKKKQYSENLKNAMNDLQIDPDEYLWMDVEEREINLDDEEPEIELPPAKPKKTYTAEQKRMFGGGKMPPDFTLPEFEFEKLVAEGYHRDELDTLAKKFYNHYKNGSGYQVRCKNWVEQFVETWVRNAYEQYGEIRKNGTYKDGSTGSVEDLLAGQVEWLKKYDEE